MQFGNNKSQRKHQHPVDNHNRIYRKPNTFIDKRISFTLNRRRKPKANQNLYVLYTKLRKYIYELRLTAVWRNIDFDPSRICVMNS